MNYGRIYEDLCNRGRGRRRRGQVLVRHFCVPLCLGGSEHAENVAMLTPREKWLADLVSLRLCEATPRRCWDIHQKVRIYGTSRNYEAVCIERAARRRASCSRAQKGVPRSEAFKAKQRIAQQARRAREKALDIERGYGPMSDEHKAKIGAAKLGRSYGPMSDEHKAKIGAAVRARLARKREAHHG